MEIIERIVADGHGPLDPSYVVIHETANPGATALNHVSYWSREPKYAVHYVGDWTGKVYHCVPNDRLCYQVGGGNAYVVGIELCHAEDFDDFYRVWELGIEWAVWMLQQYGWGIDRLISHNDARKMWGGTDHTDPDEYFESYGESWESFKQAVQDRLEGGSGPEEKVEKMYRVYNEGGKVYRVYNPNGGFHHFTLSEGEKDALVEAGWQDEGIAWEAPRSALIPVYRMYNPNNGDHYMTQNYEECESLQDAGWQAEGVPFFTNVDGPGVYCVYNPNSGEHFYTTSEGEAKNLEAAGWSNQGVAFNAK